MSLLLGCSGWSILCICLLIFLVLDWSFSISSWNFLLWPFNCWFSLSIHLFRTDSSMTSCSNFLTFVVYFLSFFSKGISLTDQSIRMFEPSQSSTPFLEFPRIIMLGVFGVPGWCFFFSVWCISFNISSLHPPYLAGVNNCACGSTSASGSTWSFIFYSLGSANSVHGWYCSTSFGHLATLKSFEVGKVSSSSPSTGIEFSCVVACGYTRDGLAIFGAT